jgi:hypothetical protein
MSLFSLADFTEVVFKSVAYRLSGHAGNSYFLQCGARGAKHRHYDAACASQSLR